MGGASAPLSSFDTFFRLKMGSQPWWNPVCSDYPFSEEHWDFTPCFEATVVQLLPILLLAIGGGLGFPKLLRRFRSGERPEQGGRSAYVVKLVRSFESWLGGRFGEGC